jgi:hypothetical protein
MELPFTPNPEPNGCHFIIGEGPLQGMRCNLPRGAGSDFCRDCARRPELAEAMRRRSRPVEQAIFRQNVMALLNQEKPRPDLTQVPKLKFTFPRP